MDNYSLFQITEKELLNKAGFDKNLSVITGVDFDPKEGNIRVTIRPSEEIKGVTGKVGNNIKIIKLFKEDEQHLRYYDKEKETWTPLNITINTYGCERKSPEELTEKLIKLLYNPKL